jgi:hypothetical protein
MSGVFHQIPPFFDHVAWADLKINSGNRFSALKFITHHRFSRAKKFRVPWHIRV